MKTNHWLIPLGILGIVVAVWAALRNKGTSPTVVLQTSPSLQPLNVPTGQGVTPLGAPPVDPMAQPLPAQAVNTAVPGTSSSGVPNYTAQTQFMAGADVQPAPVKGAAVPTFYGPLQSFIQSMLPNTAPQEVITEKPGGCGCGGSGGCGTCSVSCSSNSRYTDGQGGCLSFNRASQIKNAMKSNPHAFMAASDNIRSSGVNTFDVFQQTMVDYLASTPGLVPPASPFASPV
jgi:hypothetical protein